MGNFGDREWGISGIVVILPVSVSAPSTLVIELLDRLVEPFDGESGPFEDVVPEDVTDALTPVWDDRVWQLFVDLALYVVGDLPFEVGDICPTDWARGLVHWAIQTAFENLRASLSTTEA